MIPSDLSTSSTQSHEASSLRSYPRRETNHSSSAKFGGREVRKRVSFGQSDTVPTKRVDDPSEISHVARTTRRPPPHFPPTLSTEEEFQASDSPETWSVLNSPESSEDELTFCPPVPRHTRTTTTSTNRSLPSVFPSSSSSAQTSRNLPPQPSAPPSYSAPTTYLRAGIYKLAETDCYVFLKRNNLYLVLQDKDLKNLGISLQQNTIIHLTRHTIDYFNRHGCMKANISNYKQFLRDVPGVISTQGTYPTQRNLGRTPTRRTPPDMPGNNKPSFFTWLGLALAVGSIWLLRKFLFRTLR